MPDLSLETSCDGRVIGIDEAGRGPWAGPVTITALWLNPDAFNELPDDISDSGLYKLAGNAVSVPVVEKVAKRVLKVLKKKKGNKVKETVV